MWFNINVSLMRKLWWILKVIDNIAIYCLALIIVVE